MFPNNSDLYATCSDDATMRIWSVSMKKQINFCSLNIDEKGKVLPPDPDTKDL
jgi:WD40 repeat protein